MLQDMNGNPIGPPKGSVLSYKATENQRKKMAVHLNWRDPRTYWNIVRDLGLVYYSINGPCDTICAFKPDDKIHGPKRRMLHLVIVIIFHHFAVKI